MEPHGVYVGKKKCVKYTDKEGLSAIKIPQKGDCVSSLIILLLHPKYAYFVRINYQDIEILYPIRLE